MLHATYIGPIAELKGERAIVMIGLDIPQGRLLAQFDDLTKKLWHEGKPLQFGWSNWPAEHWAIDK